MIAANCALDVACIPSIAAVDPAACCGVVKLIGTVAGLGPGPGGTTMSPGGGTGAESPLLFLQAIGIETIKTSKHNIANNLFIATSLDRD
jgi:hypothetical protein